MVNGLHLYSAFIQSALQFMPLIQPFTHTHTLTHQRQLAAMLGTNQLIRSNWGLGVLLKDTATRPGWDRTGNPLTARRQLLPPEPYRQVSAWAGRPVVFLVAARLVGGVGAQVSRRHSVRLPGLTNPRADTTMRTQQIPCP